MSDNELTTHQRVLLEEMLKHHEGYSEKMYRCSAGYQTIGYGFNLETNTMCKEAAEAQLRCDVERTVKRMTRTIPQFKHVSGARRAALIDMGFNLGVPGLRKFRKMWTAIGRNDWERAAAEAIDSRWYRQVKSRGARIVEILRTGEWPDSL
jgi:lysozyme